MQAWTPVRVIDRAHPRTGAAGICQGLPFTPQAASTGHALELARRADEAEALAVDAGMALAELVAAEAFARQAATEARQAAGDAVATAREDHDPAQLVRVKFDADGQIVDVPVAALQMLG